MEVTPMNSLGHCQVNGHSLWCVHALAVRLGLELYVPFPLSIWPWVIFGSGSQGCVYTCMLMMKSVCAAASNIAVCVALRNLWSSSCWIHYLVCCAWKNSLQAQTKEESERKVKDKGKYNMRGSNCTLSVVPAWDTQIIYMCRTSTLHYCWNHAACPEEYIGFSISIPMIGFQ